MKNPNRFYNIETLLNKKDLDGETPSIFCVSGNRSGGKTTSVNRYMLDKWLNGDFRQVMYLVRWNNDIVGYAQTLLNDDFIKYFYPTGIIKNVEKKKVDRNFMSIEIDGVTFGWVVAINASDKVKRLSSYFNQVDCIFYDEFLPETGAYCPNEIEKFKSIVVSVARGYDMQSRYIPVILASNLISVYNPYYVAWDISDRIQTDTRFLKGHGIVFEQNINKSAMEEQQQNKFLATFGNDNSYYTGEAVYLNDSNILIDKPKNGKPLLNIYHKGKTYGMYVDDFTGCYYITRKPTGGYTIACTLDDVTSEIPYIDKLNISLMMAFKRGLFRFQDSECKHVGFKYIGCIKTGW